MNEKSVEAADSIYQWELHKAAMKVVYALKDPAREYEMLRALLAGEAERTGVETPLYKLGVAAEDFIAYLIEEFPAPEGMYPWYPEMDMDMRLLDAGLVEDDVPAFTRVNAEGDIQPDMDQLNEAKEEAYRKSCGEGQAEE